MLQDDRTLDPLVLRLSRRTKLSESEHRALLHLPFRKVHFERGAYIIREGDTIENCCGLLSGFAARQRFTGRGGRQIFSIHMRGDFVHLEDGWLGSADHSVEALTSVDAVLIPQQALHDLAIGFPAIARAFLGEMRAAASICQEWLLNVGRRNARERIAHLLCELAVRQEQAGVSVGPQYDLPLTQEQVGDATGLTGIHANRTIQSLRREGLISTGNKRITVMDKPALQSVGDFSAAYLHLE